MRKFQDYIAQFVSCHDKKKIKDECKKIKSDIDYSKDNWKEKFIEKVNWKYISKYEKLSEDFIEEFKYYVKWKYIFRYQKLSEPFIIKYKNLVDDWNLISRYQKLSEPFIIKHKNEINFKELLKNYNISDKIREKMRVMYAPLNVR